MSARPWQLLSNLYYSALRRPAAERSAFVKEACQGDSALSHELESLLRYDPATAQFLDTPAAVIDIPAADGVRAAVVTQHPLEDMLGRELGPYEILEPLGSGNMGDVYRAHDRKLGRDVALKILPSEFALDAERLARFRREAQLLASLNHPHIAAIYGFEDSGSMHALVLELVEGPTLAERLQRGPLPLWEALAIAQQIAEALAEAHEKGIVHRDLKPANIVLQSVASSTSSHIRAKVLDFGLAKIVGRDLEAGVIDRPSGSSYGTATGRILGTPAYMSPEQVRGLPIDTRADIWAFGCVLFELLAGQPPFKGDTVVDVFARILDHEPDWATLSVDSPQSIRVLIERCLRKDARHRLQVIADASREIGNSVHADPEPPVTPESLPPLWPLTGRSMSATRKLASLATALVFVLVSGRSPGDPAAPPASESVLVTNFENGANQPLFDGVVEQALTVGIELAPFVTTYPRRAALRLVAQLKPGSTLDEEGARFIAIHEGINRVITGSIKANGTRYRLAVKLVDPKKGRALLTWETEASGRDDLLNAAARAAAKVRYSLGDKTADANHVKSSETFTAASIEAAHEYVRAQDLQSAGKYDEAVAAYQKAIQLDSTFGRAYAALGQALSSLGRSQEAEEYFKHALSLIDRMTDREKYRTRAGYFFMVHDPNKAREELEAFVKQYPADSNALANLAVAASFHRDMARAFDLGLKASAIYPNNLFRRHNVALFALYAGHFYTAEKLAASILAQNKNFENAYRTLAVAQLGLGRPTDAEKTWHRLQGVSVSGRDLAAHGLADLAIYEGRLGDAASVLDDAMARPPDGRSARTIARLIVTLAEVRELQGRPVDAVKLAEQALEKSSEPTIELLAGRVLLLAGQSVRALQLANDLGRKVDQEAQVYGRLLEGEAALKDDDAARALNRFREAQRATDTWLGRFGLGRASLEAGAFADAQAEFDICLKRNGEATTILLDDIPTYRLMPTVRYYVARAQEGLHSPSATDSYRVFLAIKSTGDEQGLVADAQRRVGSSSSVH